MKFPFHLRKNFNRYFFFVLVLFSPIFNVFPSSSAKVVLQPLNNLVLVDFINLSELLLEQENYNTTIRVYRIWEGPAECDGRPKTCPRYRLYLGILISGEYPERKVYVSSQAYGWHNPKIIHHPNAERRDDFIEIVVEEKVIGKNPDKNWFYVRKRKIWINLYEGYIQ